MYAVLKVVTFKVSKSKEVEPSKAHVRGKLAVQTCKALTFVVGSRFDKRRRC